MTIIEQLEKRGVYRGELRRYIEAGIVFQLDAKGNRVPARAGAHQENDPATTAGKEASQREKRVP